MLCAQLEVVVDGICVAKMAAGKGFGDYAIDNDTPQRTNVQAGSSGAEVVIVPAMVYRHTLKTASSAMVRSFFSVRG